MGSRPRPSLLPIEQAAPTLVDLPAGPEAGWPAGAGPARRSARTRLPTAIPPASPWPTRGRGRDRTRPVTTADDAQAATDRRFARVLAATRADLAAIRSLQSLAESYARESFNRGGTSAATDAPDRRAVLAAYALRWLELSVEADEPPSDVGAPVHAPATGRR